MSLVQFIKKSRLYFFAIPFLFVVIGAGLNQIAVNCNHDSMPVVFNEGNRDGFIHEGFPRTLPDGTVLLDPRHSLLTSKSRTFLLDDIVDFGTSKFSVGDGFLYAADWMLPLMPYFWGMALYADLRKKED